MVNIVSQYYSTANSFPDFFIYHYHRLLNHKAVFVVKGKTGMNVRRRYRVIRSGVRDTWVSRSGV